MTLEITVHPLTPDDLPEVLELHARAFGPGRFARTAYRIREGTQPISHFCMFSRVGGELVAAIRFTEVTVGGKPGVLLLGPLAVEERYAGLGYGKRLVAEGIERAKAAGIKLVLLVGDEPYYARFGFKRTPPGRFLLPGPVDPARVLAAELAEGAMQEFEGPVEAAG
ncbi:MAG: GNAT family N-acetyltransferase [Hyphomicrobiaceae bacterium]